VSALNPAASLVQRRDEHLFDFQCLDAHAGADDIRDGIERAYLVESYLLGRLAVNRALRDGQSAENTERMGFDECRQVALLDQGADLAEGPPMGMSVLMFVLVIVTMTALVAVFMVLMRVVVMMFLRMLMLHSFMVMVRRVVVLILLVGVGGASVNAEFHPFNSLSGTAFEMHVEIPDVQFGEFPLKGGGINAEIAQSANGHVAADARETVKIENAHAIKLVTTGIRLKRNVWE